MTLTPSVQHHIKAADNAKAITRQRAVPGDIWRPALHPLFVERSQFLGLPYGRNGLAGDIPAFRIGEHQQPAQIQKLSADAGYLPVQDGTTSVSPSKRKFEPWKSP